MSSKSVKATFKNHMRSLVGAVFFIVLSGCFSTKSAHDTNSSSEIESSRPNPPLVVMECMKECLGIVEIVEIRNTMYLADGESVWFGIDGTFTTTWHWEKWLHFTWVFNFNRAAKDWRQIKVFFFRSFNRGGYSAPDLPTWFSLPKYERESYIKNVHFVNSRETSKDPNTNHIEKSSATLQEIVNSINDHFALHGLAISNVVDSARGIYEYYKEAGNSELERESWNIPVSLHKQKSLEDLLNGIFEIDLVTFDRKKEEGYYGSISIFLTTSGTDYVIQVFEKDIPFTPDAPELLGRIDATSTEYWFSSAAHIYKIAKPMTDDSLFDLDDLWKVDLEFHVEGTSSESSEQASGSRLK